MIVNISANGTSFRGAGKYYLHDKDDAAPKHLKPSTDERVVWTDTRNLAHDNPDRAMDEMWATADMQVALKMASGVRLSGRPCDSPVKTISLSWHPSETVMPEHMVAAADQLLTHMGWQDHQAVYIGHKDTAHPHMHIVLNRVHPETGRTLDDYKERVRANEWALSYELEQGRVLCEKRLDNTRQNTNDNTRSLPQNVIHLARPSERQFMQEETTREALDQLERAGLKQHQREEREAFFREGRTHFKELRHQVFSEVRAEYKDTWRDFYKEKKEREAEAVLHSESAIGRAMHFLRDGQFAEANEAFFDRNAVHDAVTREFAARRAEIRDEQRDETRARQDAACTLLREQRTEAYEALKQRQRDERTELREIHDAGERAPWLLDPARPRESANQNQQGAERAEPPITIPAEVPAEVRLSNDPAIARAVLAEAGREVAPEPSHPVGPRDVPDGNVKQPTDLAATMIGSVAGYVADQMAEFFAPTPPEVREARVKAEAKREAEKPEPAPSPYAKVVEAALRAAEEQREQQRAYTYWRERDRGKDWDRDR